MCDKVLLFKARKAAILLGAVLLTMPTVCSGYDDGPRAGSVTGGAREAETAAVLQDGKKSHYITDASSLTNLSKLAYLNLSGNALTDITPLLALSHLVELDVQNNYLDLSPTSAAMSTILALTQRGVMVNYKPQRVRPMISSIPDQTIGIGGESPFLKFQYAPDSATLTVHSSNPGLIPETNILLTPSRDSAHITLTPVDGASGRAVITVTATVDKGMSASTSLTVNVVPGSPSPIMASQLEELVRDRLESRPERKLDGQQALRAQGK
jgi:hypothetical protein